MRRIIGLVGLSPALYLLSLGCPDDPGQINPPANRGTLVALVTDQTGTEAEGLASDGTSFVVINVTARNGAGQPWNGSVEFVTDRGAFGAGLYQSQTQATTNPNGEATVQFFCAEPGTGAPEDPGAANISIRNELAFIRLTLTCEYFDPAYNLTIEGPSGVTLHADNVSTWTIVATAVGRVGEPVQGENVTFTVSPQPLIVDDEALVTSTVARTDVDGKASVEIKAPASPGSVEVSAVWEYDELGNEKEDSVTLSFQPDQSGITLIAERYLAPADGATQVPVFAQASNHDGSPMADGEVVTFRTFAPGSFGNPPVEEVNVEISGGNGEADALLNPQNEEGVVSVEASFFVAAGQSRSAEAIEVEFVEPGVMILTLTADPDAIFTDDQEVAEIVVGLERDGIAVDVPTPVDIWLSDQAAALATFGQQGASSSVSHVTKTTNNQGQTSVQLRGLTRRAAGSVWVNASVTDGEQVIEVTKRVLLKRNPILQSVIYVGANPSTLGTRGSSRQATTVVSFKAFDDNNQPMEGIEFRFLPPITIDPEVIITTVGGGDTTLSDTSGEALAYLSAGPQAHPVRVIAQATDQRTGESLIVTSDAIPITSGLPSWSHSWFVCDEGSRAAQPPLERSCAIILADRFSERVPGATIQFRVESGNITPTATVAGDGRAEAIDFYSGGFPGPADTLDELGQLGTLNPTDMLVTHVAYTRGEEPFSDMNGNGYYDGPSGGADCEPPDYADCASSGEPFIDFPEPYIDKHDDCRRTDVTHPFDITFPTEPNPYYIDPTSVPGGVVDPALIQQQSDPFVDGNNDGIWNGANHLWDSDTLIWFQERTLFVYPAVVLDVVDVYCADYTGDREDPNFLRRCGGSIAFITKSDSVNLRFRAVDFMGNCAAPGKQGTYTWRAYNARGDGFTQVGVAGCGLNTGYPGRDENDHWQPFCLQYDNLVINEGNLQVIENGVGSHPFDASFTMGGSVVGQDIELTVTFQGSNTERSRTMNYLIPCASHMDCGNSTIDGQCDLFPPIWANDPDAGPDSGTGEWEPGIGYCI